MSANDVRDMTEFRPRAVVVDDDALSTIRSLAAKHGVNPKRAYGLAMEFAAGFAETDDFDEYVAAAVTRHEDDYDT